jgi:hypothetical protein
MLPFKTYFLSESFDNPYRYKNTFTTEAIEKEDDDTGETYMDEVLTPLLCKLYDSKRMQECRICGMLGKADTTTVFGK